jgi:deoxyribodipyrimidine photo-lyase
MNTAIMLFTRDLRVRDNPALAAAAHHSDRVVPLFVFDDAILNGGFAAPNRLRFLLDSLSDLRESLRGLGGDLVVRRGDPVAHVARIAEETGARSVTLAADRSAFATRRLAALRELRLEVSAYPGITVVPPGALVPAGGDHYRVFTPYWRAWQAHYRDFGAGPGRPVAEPPAGVRLPKGIRSGPLPHLGDLTAGAASPCLPAGGERAGRERMRTWLRESAADYALVRDDLAADRTSRLSPYLKFGCVSPRELAGVTDEAYRRQLAWRDFHHQVAAAFPQLPRRDYRARGQRWERRPDALDAWREGATGVPVVDAGMRQLRREGFMHNRARMIAASFLTRTLGIDWRDGLRHFSDWLVDGDIADNAGNWQWIAGTGNSARPNLVMNPLRQASRFDPGGDYVRTYVPELVGVEASHVHRPWTLPAAARRSVDYPAPVIGLGPPG